MKSYNRLFTLLLLFCQACNHQDDESVGSCLAIFVISMEDDGLIKNDFDSNDRIGIFQVEYMNNSPGMLGDLLNPGRYNVPYVFENGFWRADGVEEILLDGTFSDLYVYYPYDAEIGIEASRRNLSAYPFTVSGNQRQSLEQSDFLWAKIEQVSAGAPEVNVIVRHLMSRCVINLRFCDMEEVPEDPDLMIHNTNEHCTINLRTGVVSPVQYELPIIPHRMDETENGFDFSYEAIVVPQLLKEDTPLFSVTINGEILIYETEYDIQLESGNSYEFNMTVSNAIMID